MSPQLKHSLIALTGFMGSGKSSVGKALASLLGWQFVDLDCEIEKAEGRRIREIFAAEGEPRFREIESASLRSVLASTARPFVFATGGGAFVQAESAEFLRTGGAVVVFLHARPETLMHRCCAETGEDGVRPLAQDREAFRRLYAQRLPLYERADLTVDSDKKSPAAVAREIAERLSLLQKAGSSSAGADSG
ncbi:MAG: shikimate kinase [Candidatus Korobacteraceae bacterium]